jgi:hypothetical protein
MLTLLALTVGAVFVALPASGSRRPNGHSAAEDAHSHGRAPIALADWRAAQVGAGRIAPSLRRHFALFRTTARRLARSAVDHRTPPILVARFGLDPARAETVQLTPSFAVTLYPGGGGACMNWPNADGISGAWRCDLTANVDAGSLIGDVALTPHGANHEVFGLVPDGESTVVVQDAAGTSQTVPVRGNMFVTDVGSTGHWTLTAGSAKGGVQTWHGIIRPGG